MNDLEYSFDLDQDDLTAFRQHSAETLFCQIKDDVDFDSAVKIQVDYYQFMWYIMDKYGLNNMYFSIDEVTGKVYTKEME